MSINKIFFAAMLVLIASLAKGQDIFIKTINPTIDGESAVSGHAKEIIAVRFAQEASSCDIANPGSGGGVCKTTTSSFAFDLNIDKAIIGLRGAMYKGTRLQKVQITFRKPGSSPFEYYKITLGDAVVSKITDATNGNSNQCQVQFSAVKYFWTYTSQSSTGAAGTPVTFGWNSVTNSEWDGN